MYRIGIDIGGTFTDCAILDERAEITMGKARTTPPDFERGVLDSIKAGASRLNVSLEDLLSNCSHLIHGCTVATNAIVERKGSKVGLITTKGHEDTIIIGKLTSKIDGLSATDQTYYYKLHKPEPQLVARELIRGVTERVGSLGEVIVPLDLKTAETAVDYLVGKGVEGIAICLLWSFQNPDHEHQIYNLIKKKYPDIECTCSVDLAPVMGEYQRTVATVINVYIKKKVVGYLTKLTQDLKSARYDKPLFVISSSGGMTSVADACVRTLQTIDSGPVGGILGTRYYAEVQNEPNCIATDVGGTSFDVGIVERGMLQLEKEPVIDQYKFFWPRVMVRSIGAGGGSIAKAVKGVIQVGPESAGAMPGPACYGLGGTEPTVTDADLVLGYLNPDYFLGGSMKLDKKKAEAAIKKIADELGLSVLQSAAGIKKVIDAKMADLIRVCTIEKGFDPRDFVLTCYGGSGPAHAAAYSADVQAKKVFIPFNATVFSAVGMLTGKMLHTFEYSSPIKSPFHADQFVKINTLFEQLEKKLYNQFSEEGVQKRDIEVQKALMMRFSFQFHQVEVAMPNRNLDTADDGLVERLFVESYEAVYGKGSAVAVAEMEITGFRIIGLNSPFLPKLKKQTKGPADPSKALKGERPAYSEAKGDLVKTKVYDGDKLTHGHHVKGPAIIERWGDTVVIPDDQEGDVDEYNNIMIRVRSEKK